MLMLIIIIALSGLAYGYISGMFNAKTSTAFSIVDIYNDTITIRNDGTAFLTSLTATVDGSSASVSMFPSISGLVGYWRFDEGRGSIVADDSSYGKNGNIYYHERLIADWIRVSGDTRPIYGTPAYNRSSQSMTFLKNGAVNGTDNLYLKLLKVGSPTGPVTIRFSTARNGGGISTTLLAENLPAIATNVNLTLPANNIVSGVTYYLTVEYLGGDASNYVGWVYGLDSDNSYGGSGTAWFNDTQIFGNDTAVNLTVWTVGWVSGEIGSAVDFDGHNTYVSVGPQPYASMTGDKSIFAWIKPDTPRDMAIFDTEDPSWGTTGYDFIIQSNRLLRFKISNGTTSEYKTSSGMVNIGEWNYVGFVYNNSTHNVTFYINGIPSGTSTFTSVLNHLGGTYAFMGNEDGISGEYTIDGALDEVQIYNRILSEDDIKSISSGLSAPGQSATVKILTPLSKGTHTARICTASTCQGVYLLIT